jgi:hypothetical protein
MLHQKKATLEIKNDFRILNMQKFLIQKMISALKLFIFDDLDFY